MTKSDSLRYSQTDLERIIGMALGEQETYQKEDVLHALKGLEVDNSIAQNTIKKYDNHRKVKRRDLSAGVIKEQVEIKKNREISLGKNINHEEDRKRVYSDIEENLVSDSRHICIGSTNIIQNYKKPNSKSFVLSAVRFLNYHLCESSLKYFATYSWCNDSYSGGCSDGWEINRSLTTRRRRELDHLKTGENYQSLREIWVNLIRPRESIAGISTCKGSWWTNYPLSINANASEDEKNILLLWDEFRRDYIPSDPNFPIEEAYWLKNIVSLRKKGGFAIPCAYQ